MTLTNAMQRKAEPQADVTLQAQAMTGDENAWLTPLGFARARQALAQAAQQPAQADEFSRACECVR